MPKIPRSKTAMGLTVGLAIEALRNPNVQAALRQAPGLVASFRDRVSDEGGSAVDSAKRKVLSRFGQGRLVARAAALRELVAVPAIATRLGPDAVAKTLAALDSIDTELLIAKQQDLRDRFRMHRKIGRSLDELVDALGGPHG